MICLHDMTFFIPLYGIGGGDPAVVRKELSDVLKHEIFRSGSVLRSTFFTILSLLLAVPLGVGGAIYLAEYANRSSRIVKAVRLTAETLAGIPSIVYGYFGMMVIAPLIRDNFGGTGYSILTASIVLGIMILPTVIGVSESALRALPNTYYEGALALGATHERAVFMTEFPAARSGILTSVVLGLGRVVGETMAVVMIVGNSTALPDSLLDGVRTMTSHIVLELGYATDLHRGALIATAAVLFVFILLINLCFSAVKRKADAT